MIQKNGIKAAVVVSFFMFSQVGFADKTAPTSWNTPVVPKAVSSNVLYLPISSPAVKKVRIQNSKEDLIDLLEMKNARIRPLATLDPRYKNSCEGYSKVRSEVYQKLVSMLDHLPNDIGIAYFEGFRPLHKQKEYFDKKLKETLLKISDKESAYKETSKLVSPFIDNIPTHCTGAAIDMTLFRIVNGKPQLLDMGKFGVISGDNNQQETFSPNTTALQRANRLLLLKAATESDLVNYGWEWWHYSFRDRVWAYVKGEKYAKYGLAVNREDPILFMDKKAYLKQF